MCICPVCNSQEFALAVDSAAIDAECQLRDRFIDARLCRPASPSERKDLTDFFHAAKAELRRCTQCGQLLRHELEKLPADEYSSEAYDPTVMEAQYPRYVRAFQAKRNPYRDMLPSGARVVEVGSHYGAFLQTASEWGWHAEGVDVGRDTSRFAQSKGFTVHRCELHECTYQSASRDAVFIWNCFEQIDRPEPLLNECRRILKPGGLLVLRTPNGLFYTLCRDALQSSSLGENGRAFLIDALAYNNLLGFPYLYGYSAERLIQCAGRYDFESAATLNSELITLPLPEDPDWVKREERVISSELRFLAESTLSHNGVSIGPWIECSFRNPKPLEPRGADR